MIFFVEYSVDMRSFQLLGTYDFPSGDEAIIEASKNHGEEGTYAAIPQEGVVVKGVIFNKVPVLTDPVPTDPAPVT